MNTEDFLKYMSTRNVVTGGSEMHKYMSKLTNEVMKLVSELNGKYHSPEEVREIFFKITGKQYYVYEQNIRKHIDFIRNCSFYENLILKELRI